MVVEAGWGGRGPLWGWMRWFLDSWDGRKGILVNMYSGGLLKSGQGLFGNFDIRVLFCFFFFFGCAKITTVIIIISLFF